MALRILTKSDTMHMANLASILLAFGSTCYYFDAIVTNPILGYINNFMLSPVIVADYIISYTTFIPIAGNKLAMFIVLWLTYFPVVARFSSLLIIKDYKEMELKNWYYSKRQVN